MLTATRNPAVYPRLCVAYFLQFAIWGSWGIALGGYAGGTLGLTGTQVGMLYLAIPLGAIISPLFIGPIADRYFSAQKVIALLHVLGGLCLLLAGMQTNFSMLMLLMLLHGICYMPTIALVNTVVFKHLPDARNAPYVFVFGTFGWIVINLVIELFCGGMATSGFLYAGAVCCFALGAYSLSLPDTPPKGVPAEGGSALGLDALQLLKKPAFAIFVGCVFLASIPACNFYFPVLGPMLQQRGYPAPLALGTLNQVSELLFMSMLPFFVARIGLKKVVIIGMLAWAFRYLFFMGEPFVFALVGLLLHGFCYSFLYVGAYMYGERVAPDNMKASVQSLLTFLLLGVGQAIGGAWQGAVVDRNGPAIAAMGQVLPEKFINVDDGKKTVGVPPWANPQLDNSVWRYLDLSSTAKQLVYGPQPADPLVVALTAAIDADNDGVLTTAELLAATASDVTVGDRSAPGITVSFKDAKGQPASKTLFREDVLKSVGTGSLYDVAITDGYITEADITIYPAWQIQSAVVARGETLTPGDLESIPAEGIAMSDGKVYTKDDIAGLLAAVASWKKTGEVGKLADLTTADLAVSRTDWLRANVANWTNILAVPSVFIFVMAGIFLVLGRDPEAAATDDSEK